MEYRSHTRTKFHLNSISESNTLWWSPQYTKRRPACFMPKLLLPHSWENLEIEYRQRYRRQYHTLHCKGRDELNQCHWLNVACWKVCYLPNFTTFIEDAPQKTETFDSNPQSISNPHHLKVVLLHLCKVQFSHQLMIQQLLWLWELRELPLSKRVPKNIIQQLQWL